MRRIAIINQKGGVGKTTTAVNLGAALARLGRRVVVVDMDPQANASMNLGAELGPDEPSTYSILTRSGRVSDTLRGTSTPGLAILPAHLDLSGAELELASAIGRESILRDALDDWEREERERTGRAPADVVLVDNPPSLGLLSVNGLTAAGEVLIAVQTEFFALQGLSKLVEVVQLLRRRMNPDLEITGVLACMYDSRLRLGREVLAELREHFPKQLYARPIAQNVKLAETPSFSRTIYEYAPDSKGAEDYLAVAREFLEREGVEAESESGARSAETPPPPALAQLDEPPSVDGGPPPAWGTGLELDDREPGAAEADRTESTTAGSDVAVSEVPVSEVPGRTEAPELDVASTTAVLAPPQASPVVRPEPTPAPAPEAERAPELGPEPVRGPADAPATEPVPTDAGSLALVTLRPAGRVSVDDRGAAAATPLQRPVAPRPTRGRGEERASLPRRRGPLGETASASRRSSD